MFWRWLRKRMERQQHIRREREQRAQLLHEIWRAHAEWVGACDTLNYVDHPDEVDYAVYCMETAQKRYEMLLRVAKKERLRSYYFFH